VHGQGSGIVTPVAVVLTSHQFAQMLTIKGFHGSIVGARSSAGVPIIDTNHPLVRNYLFSTGYGYLNICSKSLNFNVLAVKMAPVQGTLPVRINEE